MAENVLTGVNKLEQDVGVIKSSVPKILHQKNNQNISFFSFIRVLLLPPQVELKDQSIRVKDPTSDSFSLKQKHEFSRVFYPSASDFFFLSKSLEQFTNNSFFILAVFGSINIRRLFNYLDFKSYYIFDFDFDTLGKLIHDDFDLSNEHSLPIEDASSTTYFTPKIHYLINGKTKRNITIYIPEGYCSIIRSLKQITTENDQLVFVLLSQLSDSHKDKYNSILSSLSLSTKSLISPKSDTNDNNKDKSSRKLKSKPITKIQKNVSNISKNKLPVSSDNDQNDNVDSKEQVQNSTKENKKKSPNSFKEKNEHVFTQHNQDFPKNENQSDSNLITSVNLNKDIQSVFTTESEKEYNNNNENTIQSSSNINDENPESQINHIQNTPITPSKSDSQSNFLKQIMESTSSPNELSGIFDTLGTIIKRSENGWKQTDSELNDLQSKLEEMKATQSKEAELLRIAEKNLEQLQEKLNEVKKRRIDLLNEKEKLNSYVTRSISITTKMKIQVREVVDRSSKYEKRVNEVTQEMISSMESEASEAIQSHELMTEMEILQSEIDNHLKIL